ncbi:MAG: hypothetical protein JXB23_10030, partial [Candidatus Aminicenantes bacterium]|nr:hypothetical protein [Candidatus Aminicenantes bacterium]
LIKVDLFYFWYAFLIPCILALILLFYVGIWLKWPNSQMDLLGTRTLLMLLAGLAFYIRFFRRAIEKRDRYHSLLPLSQNRIAFSRVIFVICLWVVFVMLYWLSTAKLRPYHVGITVFEILAVSGFVLMANALPYIYRDVSASMVRSMDKVLWMIIMSVLNVVGIVFFLAIGATENSWKIFQLLLPLRNVVSKVAGTFPGALLFLLLGLGMTLLSVLCFKKKRSFVE